MVIKISNLRPKKLVKRKDTLQVAFDAMALNEVLYNMTIISDIATFVYRYISWAKAFAYASAIISVGVWDYFFWDTISGDPFPILTLIAITAVGIFFYGYLYILSISLISSTKKLKRTTEKNWNKHIEDRETERELERVNLKVREKVGGALSIAEAQDDELSLPKKRPVPLDIISRKVL